MNTHNKAKNVAATAQLAGKGVKKGSSEGVNGVKSPMGRVLIVAGTFAQALRERDRLGLAEHEWAYALDAHSLRGWLPTKIIRVGTYAMREDWYDLSLGILTTEARMRAAKKEKKS